MKTERDGLDSVPDMADDYDLYIGDHLRRLLEELGIEQHRRTS